MSMYSRYAALQTVIEAREYAAQQAELQARRKALASRALRAKSRRAALLVAQLLKAIGMGG